MKKTLLAVALLAMGTGSALAGTGDQLAAGQITFNGQVDPATCVARVADGGKTSTTTDGTVTLNTVTLADMNAAGSELSDTATGLKPKDFSISVDCSKAADEELSSVRLYMGSADFANADGSLANNTNITIGSSIKMASGVNIAVHEVGSSGALSLVNMMNHSANNHILTLTNGVGTYNLRASYVKAAGTTATSGAVTTSAVYSVVYN